ncbi:unnamed protein product [Amoebophrya sp. A120]|nr:unnamed protein product [Amoebophrya sp. A120]|eukprot:GSA120T00000404001.1
MRNANTHLCKVLSNPKLVQAEIKWLVTGTPVVNKLLDVQPLLAFLELEPFVDPAWFHRLIDRPVKMGEGKGLEVLNLILRVYLLRRLKNTRVPIRNHASDSTSAAPSSTHQIGLQTGSAAAPAAPGQQRSTRNKRNSTTGATSRTATGSTTVQPAMNTRCLLELPRKRYHVVKVKLGKEHRAMYDKLFQLCSEQLLNSGGVQLQANAATAARTVLKSAIAAASTTTVVAAGGATSSSGATSASSTSRRAAGQQEQASSRSVGAGELSTLRNKGNTTSTNDPQQLNSSISVLSFITRLRQLLQHASLLPEKWVEALLLDDATLVKKLLTESSIQYGSEQKNPLQLFEEADGTDCSVCLCPLDDSTVCVTKCGHVFHYDCLAQAVQASRELQEKHHHGEQQSHAADFGGGGAPCPICRATVRLKDLVHRPKDEELKAIKNNCSREDLRDRVGEELEHNGGNSTAGPGHFPAPSSAAATGACSSKNNTQEQQQLLPESAKLAKFASLVHEIRLDTASTHDAKPGSVVVFSSFVQTLRLAKERLGTKKTQPVSSSACGTSNSSISLALRAELFTGATKPSDRRQLLTDFQEGKIDVLLCSLACAGVGITLTRARAVILLEPWWNSALEEQAVDRVHRIGFRHKQLDVYRIIVENSIEERIQKMQESKQSLLEGAVDRSVESSGAFSSAHSRKLKNVMVSLFDTSLQISSEEDLLHAADEMGRKEEELDHALHPSKRQRL